MLHLTDIGRLLKLFSEITIILLTDNDIVIVYIKSWSVKEIRPDMKFKDNNNEFRGSISDPLKAE